MPTPSIQILRTDAQQVLNLDSISAVRSVVAASLANANSGTPLNPNLTTQQLWNEFYQIVTQPKSDIESIIANQLMKFLYAPPAPGGAGADKQVIFNDGGVLAGDPQFLWNKTTNLLTVTGAATITGDLTVRTNKLAVTSTGVGVNYTSPAVALHVGTTGATNKFCINTAVTNAGDIQLRRGAFIGFSNAADIGNSEYIYANAGSLEIGVNASTRFAIASDGVATWSNVGGVAGTAMTLNATGLGVGTSPAAKLHVEGNGAQGRFSVASATDARHEYYRNGVIEGLIGWDANVFKMFAFQSGGKLEFYTGGSNLRATLKSTGQLRFVPLAADPAGAEAGDVYYNSTSNKLKCYNGTTWNDLF